MTDILVVEDDEAIANLICVSLSAEGYRCTCARDGMEGADYIERQSFDLVLLDIMLPEVDGYELLEYIKPTGTPVIFLTAKGSIEDKVRGLRAGADDYLPKPFASREFIARVKALSRRSGRYEDLLLTFGDLRLDCNRYELTCGGETVRLNNKEFQLAELFLRHPHFVFSANHLMDRIWGQDSNADINVVWTYIGFVRRKLKTIGSHVEIRTVRGAGYSLEEVRC